MKYVFPIAIFVYLLLCFSCQDDKRLQNALDFAGNNRKELEKVLEHYKDSGDKYQAARFLIENMPRYFYYEGAELDSIKAVKASVLKGAISTALRKKWDKFSYKKLHKVYDVHVITADYLIDNIDRAFEAWHKRPWGKYVTFDEFCELILPYRIGDEPLEYWRADYCKRYEGVLDSLYKGSDIVEAADSLTKFLKKGFVYNIAFNMPHYGPQFFLRSKVGSCKESCDYSVYAMRALGFPVAIDIYHYAPQYQSGHLWNVLKDTTGQYVPFWLQDEVIITRGGWDGRMKGKVYRTCYGLQEEKIPGLGEDKSVPSILRNRYLKDVTSGYFGENKADIRIDAPVGGKYICLGVFSPTKYIPVDVARYEKGKAEVRNIEPGVIYQPMYPKGGKLKFAGYPFYLKDSAVIYFRPDVSVKQKVDLYRKYPLTDHVVENMSKVVGGRIEGANTVDFRKADELYRIEQQPAVNYNKVFIKPDKKFRYIRYTADKTKRVNIGELAFYNHADDTARIEARMIAGGPPMFRNERTGMDAANDGDYLTFAFLEGFGGSIIFDFGKPERIEKVVYVPRNDENFISIGDEYELFYHKGAKGWVSLGRKKATEPKLTYDNIPANALLWLRDVSRGQEEQVFWIENGKQAFLGGVRNW